jgi:cytochrome c biogenesis protein CcmG/thiol:disulfide interchange protein DsbE
MPRMKRGLILWLPLALVIALFIVFWRGLMQPDDHVIASQMVGKPLPEFAFPAAMPGQPGAGAADFRDGKPKLLNVFASWCLPCIAEVPVLMQMKAQGADVVGVAIHDTTPALEKFLGQHGNPYSRIGHDTGSRLQIALGSSGVPETFVIDGKGMIVHQHIGVVSETDVPKLMAMLGQRP